MSDATKAPGRHLIEMCNASWISRCLHVVVQYRVADQIRSGPLTLDELALACGVDVRFLGPILRILSDNAIFLIAGSKVSHSAASYLLDSDHPASIAPIIDWMGSPEVWASLGQLPTTMTTGEPGFEVAHATGLFEYLAGNPERSSVFNRHMSGFTQKEVTNVVRAIDLAGCRNVLDIGAGTGLLASTIANVHPGMEVLAFDLPGTLPDCLPGVSTIVGDFFHDPLPSADAAIFMNILHDWNDDQIVVLLAAAHAALHSGGQLYVVEGLVAEDEHKVDMVDLGMAVMTGGRQRNRAEYETLLRKAGFLPTETTRCSEYLSVIEARRE